MPAVTDILTEARAEWVKLDQAWKAKAAEVGPWAKDQAEKFKAEHGRLPTDGDDLFDRIDAAYLERDKLRQQADNARASMDQLMRASDHGGYTTDDIAGGLDREARERFGRTLGARLIASEGYAKAATLAARAGSDESLLALTGPKMEIAPLMTKAEWQAYIRGDYGQPGFRATTVTGGGATQGAPFVINDQVGYVPYRRKTPVALGLVGAGSTGSDTVEYQRQTAVSTGAAEVAEDTAAAESAIAFETVTSAVADIAHFIPITRRALADAPQLETIVNNDVLGGVVDRIDTQIPNGNGSGQNLTGIYNVSGIQTMALGVYTRADAMHRANTKVEIAAGVLGEVEAWGMYPTDWESLRLEKDSSGAYIFGPPSIPGPKSAWGKPVSTSTVWTAGTPLGGMFDEFSTAWIREAPQVFIGLDGNDFTKRRMSILGEARLAFGVKRPTAFITITGF